MATPLGYIEKHPGVHQGVFYFAREAGFLAQHLLAQGVADFR